MPTRGWTFEQTGEHALWTSTASKASLRQEVFMAAVIALTLGILALGVGLLVIAAVDLMLALVSTHSPFTGWLFFQPASWAVVGLFTLTMFALSLQSAIGRVVTRFEFDRDQRRVIVERRALHFRRLKPVLEVIAFEHITEFVCEVHGERAHFRLEIKPTRHRASALNLGSALPPDLGLEQLRWLQPALGEKLYVRYVSLIDGRLQLQRVPYPPPQHPPIEPL